MCGRMVKEKFSSRCSSLSRIGSALRNRYFPFLFQGRWRNRWQVPGGWFIYLFATFIYSHLTPAARAVLIASAWKERSARVLSGRRDRRTAIRGSLRREAKVVPALCFFESRTCGMHRCHRQAPLNGQSAGCQSSPGHWPCLTHIDPPGCRGFGATESSRYHGISFLADRTDGWMGKPAWHRQTRWIRFARAKHGTWIEV